MKKAIAIVLTLAMLALPLAGCGDSQAPASSAAPSAAAAPGESRQEPAPAKKTVIKVGYENATDELLHKACEAWKEYVERESGGEIEMQLFPNSQLGNKKDLYEQAQMGANVVTMGDGSFLMDFVPDMGITCGPYLFDSKEDAFKVMESDWWTEKSKELEEKGLFLLTSNWIYGVRQTISKKPVKTPEDFKGMKIRCPDNLIYTRFFELMGATPTPMPLGDVYTSLQQGVIDGAENPLPVIYGNKQYEVAKYISLTNHMLLFTGWVAGSDFIGTIPAEHKQILIEGGNYAGTVNNDLLDQKVADTTKKLEEAGVTIIEVDTAPFREKVASYYEMFPEWSDGLYDKIQGIINS
ncbi:C4-dicarboxylate ABC transporter substrate-binding protein [Anaerotruncus sp. AF02-27]|uniref:C4-dicarboxylate TRAP transporter substrate-binding protein n=1 Tax=Anaerotruncus sp. AF02-27 TaxID=2292191 RepID=UPI000E48B8B9|nr:C4-dicarboxylate TRAP transporter substrate-binding protein [Anaerotruncus sp. AF02-27]RGX57023.1 C4-dicarboxylate ABC transporter substrate-binding protein [Anaerotruncus sp. AF02-27]